MFGYSQVVGFPTREGNTGTRVLCPRAHIVPAEKLIFPYSKSIGAFNVGIGFFSIRLADCVPVQSLRAFT